MARNTTRNSVEGRMVYGYPHDFWLLAIQRLHEPTDRRDAADRRCADHVRRARDRAPGEGNAHHELVGRYAAGAVGRQCVLSITYELGVGRKCRLSTALCDESCGTCEDKEINIHLGQRVLMPHIHVAACVHWYAL